MCKLDELINELCPDGVEYKPLSDKTLFEFHYGRGNKIPEDIGGKYDVYGANGIVSHINEYNCEDISIIGHIGAVGFINRCKGKCFVTYNGTIANIVDKSKVNTQYFYYVLTTLDLPSYKKGSQPFLSVSDFDKIEIPVPPLPVQDEIVRILDTFTSLTAELTAELTARRKQYEYYRDSLLTFGDDVERKSLGEISTINRGVRVTRDMLSSECIIPVYQNALAPLGYFDKSNRTKDTTFVISAGAAGQIGYSGIDFWAADDCFTFDNNKDAISKYIFYFLQTKQSYIDSRVRRGSIPRISRDVFAKLSIPLPSLEKQKHIVAILDRFESLCNDITSGLPAEIEARQKQYEYYRDKLLTFKRKEA